MPLWIDELYTWKAVSGGLGETLGEVQYLPYYSVVWGFTTLANCQSEACLRLPSALAMILAVGFVAAACARLFGLRAAVLAGLLMALAPSIQRWGQDARPYGLAAALVATAMLVLVWAMQTGRSLAWIGYAGAVVASTLVVPMTAGQIGGHGLLIATAPWALGLDRRWRPWLLVTAPSLILILTLTLRYRALIQGDGGFHSSDVFHPQVGNIMQLLYWPLTGNAFGTVSAGAFSMGVVVLALLSRAGMTWLAAGAVCVLGLWIISFLGSSFWLGRFAVPFVGFAFIGVGATLAWLPRRTTLLVMPALVLAAFPTYTENVMPWSRGYDWRTAMNVVDEGWAEGDALVFESGMQPAAGWAIDYYGQREGYALVENPNRDGRSWIINDQQSCPQGTVWDLGYGNTLTVCPGVGASTEATDQSPE